VAGKAALGKVLARMGKDKEAEAQFTQAVRVIEAIAEKLKTSAYAEVFSVRSRSWSVSAIRAPSTTDHW